MGAVADRVMLNEFYDRVDIVSDTGSPVKGIVCTCTMGLNYSLAEDI